MIHCYSRSEPAANLLLHFLSSPGFFSSAKKLIVQAPSCRAVVSVRSGREKERKKTISSLFFLLSPPFSLFLLG